MLPAPKAQSSLLGHGPELPKSRRPGQGKGVARGQGTGRGRSSPAPEPDARLRPPLRAGTPRNAPGKRSGADDALCPAGPSALLLRARRLMFRAPHARRLRPAWGQDRPARRQGPAGASDPGHDAGPACGRGARCCLVQLAGRSPFMMHSQGAAVGARTCLRLQRDISRRAGVVCSGPAEGTGWAARPSGHGPASRNPVSARTGSSIPLQSLSHRQESQPWAPCGCGWSPRAFLVAVTAHPAPPEGRCVGVWAVSETDDGAWEWQGQCRWQAWECGAQRRRRGEFARVAL